MECLDCECVCAAVMLIMWREREVCVCVVREIDRQTDWHTDSLTVCLEMSECVRTAVYLRGSN